MKKFIFGKPCKDCGKRALFFRLNEDRCYECYKKLKEEQDE